MFQGLLWPLTPSPAPETGLQGLQGRAAGRSLVVAPHVGSGPAPGCPWAALTQALGGCWLSSLPAEPWEPGEQADPWDREPAAFPAPPTHSPGPALPPGSGGGSPPSPALRLPGWGGGAQRLSRPPPGLPLVSAQTTGIPRLGSARPPGGGSEACALPSASRAVRGPFPSQWRPEAPPPPGCQREPLGGRPGAPRAGAQPREGPGPRRQRAGERSAWEPEPQGSRVPGLPLWEAGGGGTGFSGRGVGWGQGSQGLSG